MVSPAEEVDILLVRGGEVPVTAGNPMVVGMLMLFHLANLTVIRIRTFGIGIGVGVGVGIGIGASDI